MTPDLAVRKKIIRYNVQQMAFADELEARCCVDVAGSFDGETLSGPHPKNLSQEFFDATVEHCRTILDRVKPKHSKYSLEMKGWNLPDGPDSYLALTKASDRPAFGVHIDICNAISSPTRYYNSGAFIEETFRKLGKWVLSCHGKDLKWIPEQNVHSTWPESRGKSAHGSRHRRLFASRTTPSFLSRQRSKSFLETLPEKFALAIPARFTCDVAQLQFRNELSVGRGEKQKVFLDRRRQMQQNHDLRKARRGNVT